MVLGDANADELIETITEQNYVFDLGGGDDSAAVKSTSASSKLYLNTGSGNDTILLSGRFGQSTVAGGEGKDKINFTSPTDGLTIIAGDSGNDRITATGSILGGDGDDVLKAVTNNLNPNALFWGNRGATPCRRPVMTISMAEATTTSFPAKTAVTTSLAAMETTNSMVAPATTISTGVGNDTLIGGKGADIFDVVGKDVIKDFSPGQGDMIYIDEEKYGSKISADDTNKGAVLTSEAGLKLLIEDTSTFIAQAYLTFY